MDKKEKEETTPDNPHVFKTKYSKSELNELLQWFETHKTGIPQTLRLNAFTTTSNLPRTIASLTSIIKTHTDGSNISYNGYIAHLELIRRRLLESHHEAAPKADTQQSTNP